MSDPSFAAVSVAQLASSDSSEPSSVQLNAGETFSSEAQDVSDQVKGEEHFFNPSFQVASMQELGESNEEENVNSIPEGKYKELIKRFPELLKPNFQKSRN